MDTDADTPVAAHRMPRRGGVPPPGQRARLVTEILAGVTLAALALPLNIG